MYTLEGQRFYFSVFQSITPLKWRKKRKREGEKERTEGGGGGERGRDGGRDRTESHSDLI